MPRIDQQHRDIRGRGTGRHVAGVLFVTRGVDHDEAARLGREEAVCDIDRDALLALGGEAVDQQREIHLTAGGAVTARGAHEGGDLVIEDLLRVVQQTSDQSRLAVVDGAAGDEAKDVYPLPLFEEGHEGGGRTGPGGDCHQK